MRLKSVVFVLLSLALLALPACGEKKAEEKRSEPSGAIPAAPAPAAPEKSEKLLDPGMGVPPLKDSSPLPEKKRQ